MCGRYALGIRATFVRHQLREHGMPVDDDALGDEDVRQTYNFAPGYHGIVYRADVPDYGAGPSPNEHTNAEDNHDGSAKSPVNDAKEIRYKLQAMKWGLVPFWTKRNPDYNNVLKTINARDDSLADNRGMWTTMKQRKRCIIIAQGFYEWLKKNNGKEKIPHYVKRKDDQLMCFAGMWDCVQYEGVEQKNYTYTIITTDSNKQLKFLHDRMPVILENGTDQIRTWLDPQRHEWTKELQSLLKPYDGELECYPVTKDVGKVGNNSPTFIVPVSSSENKNNIANFFVHGKSASQKGSVGQNKADIPGCDDGSKVKAEPEVKYEDERKTVNKPRSEDNAPMPVPRSADDPKPLKREREDNNEEVGNVDAKKVKTEEAVSRQVTKSSEETRGHTTPRKGRSATSNGTKPKSSPAKANDGSQKITNFFVK